MTPFPQRNPWVYYFTGIKKLVVTASIFQISGLRIHLNQQGNRSNVITCPWLLPLQLQHDTQPLDFTPVVWFCCRPGQVKPWKWLPSYWFHVSPAFIWLIWVPILGNLTPKGTRVREGFRIEEPAFYSLAHLWWL